MWKYFQVILLCACAVSASPDKTTPIEDAIKKILEDIRPFLVDIGIQNFPFSFIGAEFGSFDGAFKDVEVHGLQEFNATEIDSSVIPMRLKNLTIVIESISVEGSYSIDGMLIFPIAKNDIHVYGEGGMKIQVQNFFFTTSFSVKVSGSDLMPVVESLFLDFDVQGLKVELDHLIDGAEVQGVFNTLVTEAGPAIFRYYEPYLVKALNAPLTTILTCLLQQALHPGKPTTIDCGKTMPFLQNSTHPDA